MLGQATTAGERRYRKNWGNGENGRRTRRFRERRARHPFLNRYFLSRQNFASSVVLNLFRRVSVGLPTFWTILERYPVCPTIKSATPNICSPKFVYFDRRSHRHKGGFECAAKGILRKPMGEGTPPTNQEHRAAHNE